MKIGLKTVALCTLYSVLCTLIFLRASSADTVRMKNGSELKGIIVEDYKDRIVISMPGGEKTIMKSGIKELYFENEEDNLIKLAEQARERRDYGRAFGYYNMAYKKNPDSKAAKDGFVFLQGYLFRQEEKGKVDDMKRREAFESGMSVADAQALAGETVKSPADILKDTVGITLSADGGVARVQSVIKGSPADNAGIKQADQLVAIWGRLTGYMAVPDIINILLDKPSLEIKCTIQRTVSVNPSGARFGMNIDGMKVVALKEKSPAYESGLRKDDLITAVNGESIRYTPLREAIKSIKRTNYAKITINRELLIWRKD